MSLFHDGSRTLQDRFDTGGLDRIEEKLVGDTISDNDKAFIERLDMFFIATADEHCNPNCSYKGGDPGFVRDVDEHTIVWPNYDGNGMYLTMGNIRVNPLRWFAIHRVRHRPSPASERGGKHRRERPAHAGVSGGSVHRSCARRREVFPNCPRYIHRYQLVERSKFVPRVDTPTPVPDWKRADWARDAPSQPRSRSPVRVSAGCCGGFSTIERGHGRFAPTVARRIRAREVLPGVRDSLACARRKPRAQGRIGSLLRCRRFDEHRRTPRSESVRAVMAHYFSEMTTVIERHGGTVEKYIGDAIMAVSASRGCTRTMPLEQYERQ